MKRALLAVAISTLATSALALDPMPREAGFSGVVALGAAGGTVESNFLAEIVSIDLSDTVINDLDSPDGTDIIVPTLNFNLGYTFADMKTRVYVGTAVESSLDFSNNTVLAVRHDVDSIGSFELAGLAPSGSPVEVWENPYLTNQKRSSTEFTSSGGRITWDKIFDSNFEFIATTRTIDIDEERSGQNLGLSAAQQKLLDREGDVTRIELGYVFMLGGGENMLRTSVAYIDRDLDGDAMSQDGYELEVSHVYDGGDFKWLNRVMYQSLDGDQDNPIFNKANDADVYLLASELRFPEPFGWEKWTIAAGVQWADNDADIEFNQSSILMATGRIARSF